MSSTTEKLRAITIAEFAELYRVGPDKARHWIATGELTALNVAANRNGKPRWIITQQAIREFELVRKNAAAQHRPQQQQVRRGHERGEVKAFF